MRTIIAGSRYIDDYDFLCNVMDDLTIEPTVILCGCADGVDALGKRYAKENGIKIEYYLANWKKFDKAAGPMRNSKMVANAEALVLIWDGRSKGSGDVLAKARVKGLAIKEVIYTG